jgi:hypothetical protein
MGRNRPPEARADRQGPGRVDVTSAQEILDKRTRLVLFSVARVTKFADKDGGEKGPVPCLSVIYLIERLDGKEVHVRQTGGIDILVPGTTDWAASWSGNGGEKASNYAAYPGVAGAIDRPAARDPKNAQVVEVVLEDCAVQGKKIDLKLKGVGFDRETADYVFKNIPVE